MGGQPTLKGVETRCSHLLGQELLGSPLNPATPSQILLDLGSPPQINLPLKSVFCALLPSSGKTIVEQPPVAIMAICFSEGDKLWAEEVKR
jgi:hypothetical protein